MTGWVKILYFGWRSEYKRWY